MLAGSEVRDLDRVILHCDCNSFFASVETALDPSYRDVPMAVCGNEEQRHGIVLAKSDKVYHLTPFTHMGLPRGAHRLSEE